jgi:hypothetical protein
MMFFPRGFLPAAFTNALVLFTTSAATSTLPISVIVEPSLICTATGSVPAPS